MRASLLFLYSHILVPNCYAQPWSFDPKAYASLVEADSSQSIPPGTRIGVNNWQEYRTFLPIGVQALFSRSYQWRIPAGPDGEMVVGPTVPVPEPYKYRADTEKYAATTKLVHAADGSIRMTGYVAGLPFPDLRENDPDVVYKLIYDTYFRYHPAILFYRHRSVALDTYLNRSDTLYSAVEFKLNHISDTGYPVSNPQAPADLFFTSNITIEAPEQTKYSVNLLIYYDDPRRIEDIYIYIPSLRRSIRRSSAARCSPILGTDLVQDDLYPRPIITHDFSYRLLGHKKILFQAHLDPRYLVDESSYNLSGAPGWPKPQLGTWELRTVWVVEEQTLPTNHSYCYGTRVTYLDPDQFLTGESDIYTRELGLWKVFNSGYAPGPLYDGHGSILEQSSVRSVVLDLINSHSTIAIQLAPAQVNQQVPEKYRDAQVWALPAGLPQMSP